MGPLARRWWRAPDCWLSPGPSSLVPQLPSRDVGPYSRGPVRPAFWLSFSRSFAWALLGPARVDLTTPDQPVARPVRPLQQAAVPRLCQRPCGRLKPPPRPGKSWSEKPAWRAPEPSEKLQWRAPESSFEKPQWRAPEPLLAWPPAAAQAARRRRCQPRQRLSFHGQWSRIVRRGIGSREASKATPETTTQAAASVRTRLRIDHPCCISPLRAPASS